MVYRGSTVRIKNTITDFNGNLVDPDSQTITIYDSNNTQKQQFTSATQESTGVYYVDYTIPSDGATGSWKVVWQITKGTQQSVEVLKFNVEAP
jgi:uncharacterized protein YfaS (alpha-2-macroglobulin family)